MKIWSKAFLHVISSLSSFFFLCVSTLSSSSFIFSHKHYNPTTNKGSIIQQPTKEEAQLPNLLPFLSLLQNEPNSLSKDPFSAAHINNLTSVSSSPPLDCNPTTFRPLLSLVLATRFYQYVGLLSVLHITLESQRSAPSARVQVSPSKPSLFWSASVSSHNGVPLKIKARE